MLNIAHYKTWPTNKYSGFTLIEMAMVLLISSLLLGGLLMSLGESVNNSRRTATKNQLETIQESLFGYAQATGRLPCPANASSSGLEDPIGGGDCSEDHGFVPVRTLGLEGPVNNNGLLLDSWQNPIRYSVATYLTDSFTRSAADIEAAMNGGLTTDPELLTVCDVNDCSGNTLTDTSPAVLISMGLNWNTFTSANETENAEATVNGYQVSNDNNFVSAGYSEENFDDIIIWMSPYTLYSRLISAGQLP